MADGAECVKLIVGLGNPGAEYAASRHNAGFMVIERLLGILPKERFINSHVAESRLFTGKYRSRNLMLQMPLTYMNSSGTAVGAVSRRNNIAPEEIVVISDDLDLPPGKLRIRRGGSDGGHNGLKSVIAELGSANFIRVRVGIGRPEPGKTVDYVLSGFEGDEEKEFSASLDRAAEAVMSLLQCGLSRTMNKYNAPQKVAEKVEKEN